MLISGGDSTSDPSRGIKRGVSNPAIEGEVCIWNSLRVWVSSLNISRMGLAAEQCLNTEVGGSGRVI